VTHSAADVTRWYLIAAGVGTDPHEAGSWPVFAGHEPSTPDNCITVYDTDGPNSGRSMIDGEVFGFEGVQVRVRSKDYPTGYGKLRLILVALAESVYQTVVAVGTDRYVVHAYDQITNPIPIGRETPTSSRQVFTGNVIMTYRQLT